MRGVKIFWRPAWGGMKKVCIPFEGGWKIPFEIIQNCRFLLQGVKLFSFFTLGGSNKISWLWEGGSKFLSCQFKFDHRLLLGYKWPTPKHSFLNFTSFVLTRTYLSLAGSLRYSNDKNQSFFIWLLSHIIYKLITKKVLDCFWKTFNNANSCENRYFLYTVGSYSALFSNFL